MDLLGIKEDDGKWLPFAIDLGVINCIKMSTDESGEPTHNCSTVFCTEGNSFILDTPYEEMVELWSGYINSTWQAESGESDDDISL
jgi:hypothetical protein